MGLDVYSKLVVGAKVEFFEKTIERNKFNPDTGEPIVVASKVEAFRIAGTQIEIDPSQVVGGEDCTAAFFGIQHGSTGSNRSSSDGCFEVVLSELPFDEVRKMFAAVGYNGEPKIFVYTEMSV